MKTTSTWWKILLSGLLLAGTLVAYADATSHLTPQPAFISFPTQAAQRIA